MNRAGKKIGILFGIFIIAIAVYFVLAQRPPKNTDTMVYTSMEEATLPVVYTTMLGREATLLHGYTQEMRQDVARESLTILPDDRALPIRIMDYQGTVSGIEYEIRSMDLQRLVERTTLKEWTTADGNTTAVLPIQNLLAKEEEYILILSLNTQDKGTINYYTRIMWSDNQNVGTMVDFAVNFTTRTFDYDQARELTTYLETNSTEDNSSLGHVTIRSSYSQLTWGGLSVKQKGDIRVTLMDLDGIMCGVRLNYQVVRTAEDGTEELYESEDNFTMKWDAKRIYLMNFDRKTNQVFLGNHDSFAGKRIMLGITNEEHVASKKSQDGNVVAFTSNRDLWSYNQKDHHAVQVFSFRSGEDDGLRSTYNQHDIKILSVADNGDVDFLVYGYMNRGLHEGASGVALYKYNSGENAIEERMFAPVSLSFERLNEDISGLAHLGSNGMLYLMADQAVYGIDLNSNEYMVLADALKEGCYAVSKSGSRFAWQEGKEPYGAPVIHLMDLDTGSKQEVGGETDTVYRTLGFVGDDFIYGMAEKGGEWVSNGRVMDLPMYRLEIMDAKGEIVKDYESQDVYIADVTVEGSRVHLNQIVKSGAQDYSLMKADTIVCNEELLLTELNGISWYASDQLRKLYFVQVDKDIRSKDVKVTVPQKVAYEFSESVELKSNGENNEIIFYAYGNGHYLGRSRDFIEAMKMAYDSMGIVTDENRSIVWTRVNRASNRNIKDPAVSAAVFIRHLDEFTKNSRYDDGILLLDAKGCTLNQVLYFIGQGCPVAAFTEGGGHVLLTGYDQYNVTIYNPETGDSQKMGLNDASTHFAALGNDFVCGSFTN